MSNHKFDIERAANKGLDKVKKQVFYNPKKRLNHLGQVEKPEEVIKDVATNIANPNSSYNFGSNKREKYSVSDYSSDIKNVNKASSKDTYYLEKAKEKALKVKEIREETKKIISQGASGLEKKLEANRYLEKKNKKELKKIKSELLKLRKENEKRRERIEKKSKNLIFMMRYRASELSKKINPFYKMRVWLANKRRGLYSKIGKGVEYVFFGKHGNTGVFGGVKSLVWGYRDANGFLQGGWLGGKQIRYLSVKGFDKLKLGLKFVGDRFGVSNWFRQRTLGIKKGIAGFNNFLRNDSKRWGAVGKGFNKAKKAIANFFSKTIMGKVVIPLMGSALVAFLIFVFLFRVPAPIIKKEVEPIRNISNFVNKFAYIQSGYATNLEYDDDGNPIITGPKNIDVETASVGGYKGKQGTFWSTYRVKLPVKYPATILLAGSNISDTLYENPTHAFPNFIADENFGGNSVEYCLYNVENCLFINDYTIWNANKYWLDHLAYQEQKLYIKWSKEFDAIDHDNLPDSVEYGEETLPEGGKKTFVNTWSLENPQPNINDFTYCKADGTITLRYKGVSSVETIVGGPKGGTTSTSELANKYETVKKYRCKTAEDWMWSEFPQSDMEEVSWIKNGMTNSKEESFFYLGCKADGTMSGGSYHNSLCNSSRINFMKMYDFGDKETSPGSGALDISGNEGWLTLYLNNKEEDGIDLLRWKYYWVLKSPTKAYLELLTKYRYDLWDEDTTVGKYKDMPNQSSVPTAKGKTSSMVSHCLYGSSKDKLNMFNSVKNFWGGIFGSSNEGSASVHCSKYKIADGNIGYTISPVDKNGNKAEKTSVEVDIQALASAWIAQYEAAWNDNSPENGKVPDANLADVDVLVNNVAYFFNTEQYFETFYLEDSSSIENVGNSALNPFDYQKQKEMINSQSALLMPFGTNYCYTGWNGYPGHDGFDMHATANRSTPLNTPVMAGCDGRVAQTGQTNVGGKFVILECAGSGLGVYYGHNNSISVSVGQQVTRGQEIAKAGKTGLATGVHIHLYLTTSPNGNAYANKFSYNAYSPSLIDADCWFGLGTTGSNTGANAGWSPSGGGSVLYTESSETVSIINMKDPAAKIICENNGGKWVWDSDTELYNYEFSNAIDSMSGSEAYDYSDIAKMLATGKMKTSSAMEGAMRNEGYTGKCYIGGLNP